jgi:hypothetical protein
LKGPYNKELERTRSAQTAVGPSPLNSVLCRCRLARDERGDDAPRRAPSIKVYPGARSGSAWLQARSTTAPRLCIQCAACSAVLGRVQPAMIFTVALRSSLHQVPARRALHNNALERTRRVGVPASRAVVGVPPCRSTRCCADADWREMSEETMPLVGLPQSRSTRARGPVQRGSKRVAPRRQGSAFSAQPAAPCSAGFSLR